MLHAHDPEMQSAVPTGCASVGTGTASTAIKLEKPRVKSSRGAVCNASTPRTSLVADSAIARADYRGF